MFGFAAAAREVLDDLRSRIGLSVWAVGRQDGPDYVLLATSSGTPRWDSVGETLPCEQTLAARMLDGSAPRVAPDVLEVPAYARTARAVGSDVRAYLCVPLVDPDGRVLGALSAADTEPRPDLAAALPVVEMHGRLLGTLLAHELRILAEMRRAERAEAVADLDPLSGAVTARAWQAAVAAEDERARWHACTVSVVLVDVDGLAEVNARDGVATGDRLLRLVASTLRAQLRRGDLLARVGGDEFGVLLPETDADAAGALVDDLRRQLAAAGAQVALGVATRTGRQSVAQTVQEARAQLRADHFARGGSPRSAASDGPGRGGRDRSDEIYRPERSAAVIDVEAHPLDALLAVARERLGMDVAFLARFEGAEWVVANTAAGAHSPVRPGLRVPRSRTYCERMTTGRLERVVRDARRHPVVGTLDVTHELDIGSWMGVPVYGRDGRLYGTLCALSHSGGDGRAQLDLSLLEVLAVAATDLVDAQDRHRGPEQDVLARLDAVRRAGGPTMVFQPVVRLRDGHTVGYEALSRFPPGTPSADRWFADAAAAGVGTDLELSAVANALRRLDDVEGQLGINVSPDVLCSARFGRLLQGVPLDRVIVELTEHQVVDDYERVLDALRPLRLGGLQLAVDDVGAGFSSLLHVLRMEPDVLKLDVGMVQQLDSDARRRTLAQALSRFATDNGVLVVAEGVEREAELACLREIGISHGQGYLLGRPAPLPPVTAGHGGVSTRRGA